MHVRGSLAAVLLIALAGGCAPPSGEEDGSKETAPEEELPLEITVDSVDIVHGALRVSATMVDGAADVSVRLGGGCDHGEVGGGVSTPSTLVWSFGDNDVAEAIGCGFLVRAHVWDGTRYVMKVAELGVDVGALADAESAAEGPQVQSIDASRDGIGIGFSPVSRSGRLVTGDSIIDATASESEPEGDTPASEDATARFVVPRLDFARSVLRGQPLHLDGSSFVTSLSVGATSLGGEPQETEEPQESDTPEESDPPAEEPEDNVSEEVPRDEG